MYSCTKLISLTFSLVGGGEISKVDKDATAITPGWRTALMNVALGAWWQDETPVADITKFRQEVHNNLDVLRAMTPNSGSFVNEVCPFLFSPRLRDACLTHHWQFRVKSSIPLGASPSGATTILASRRSRRRLILTMTLLSFKVLTRRTGMRRSSAASNFLFQL
jgi:hypothetical protein